MTPTISTTPVGNRQFLGQFGNSTATLSLADLPTHNAITISFDLYVIDSWDGSDVLRKWGPDGWSFAIDGQSQLSTTFSNQPLASPGAANNVQSFGGQNVPAGSYPAFAGASEVNSLGYKFYRSSYQRLEAMDSVYRLEFTIPHVANAAKFDFRGFGLQGLADESWGLDNVRVTATTLPTVSITAEAGGTEAGEFGQFKFVRTGNLSNELVVSYTVDGTADNEIDYDLLNGSIRFDPNVSEVLLPVVTFEDLYAEGTETVRLLLTPSASYTFSQYGTATVEITEADLPVASVEWIHASRLEGESTRLRVYLDRPSVTDTIVRLELEGSATNGVDYDAVPVTLMIPAGSVETFIDVGIVDDTDDEGEEFATANVLEGIGYWILPNAKSTLLLADAGAADVRPTISWQKGPTTQADPPENFVVGQRICGRGPCRRSSTESKR